jgi:hypothetical protein
MGGAALRDMLTDVDFLCCNWYGCCGYKRLALILVFVLQVVRRYDDNTILRNVGNCVTVDTAQHLSVLGASAAPL